MNKLGIFVIVILLAGFIYLLGFPVCTADARNQHTFLIDRPYREVIRVMGKPDTMEQIIAMQNGRVIEKKWDNLVLDLEKIVKPQWQVNGHGRFVIEINDPDKGCVHLDLLQQVHIDQQIMQVKTTSIKPSGGVQLVDNYMEIKPEGEKTRFTMQNHLVVEHRIPKGYHNHMQQRVQQASISGILATEKCIQNLCIKRGILSIPIHRIMQNR